VSEHTPFDSEWEKFAMKLTKAQLVKVLRAQGIQLTAENAALREFAEGKLRRYNATPDEWDHLYSILGIDAAKGVGK
jgi:hypothetical protein